MLSSVSTAIPCGAKNCPGSSPIGRCPNLSINSPEVVYIDILGPRLLPIAFDEIPPKYSPMKTF